MPRWAWLAVLVVAVAGVAVAGSLTRHHDPVPEPVLRTVFVGDSITRGVGTDAEPSDEASWVTYAVSDGRCRWALDQNAAAFGLTLRQMQERFAGEVLIWRPEAVVIMGGTNDVLQGIPVGESMAALREMVQAAQAASIQVWIVSPPPIDPGFHKSPAGIVMAEGLLADQLGVPFIDTYTTVKAADGGWPDGWSTDGVHPTPTGARRLAAVIVGQAGS